MGMEMYVYSEKRQAFLVMRGTSQQEGFHCHLGRLPTGATTSAALFRALISDRTHRWNVTAGQNYSGDKDYGTPDLRPLHKVNHIARSMGWAEPYPELKPLQGIIQALAFLASTGLTFWLFGYTAHLQRHIHVGLQYSL
jgi:hypothetical protein